jgi:hypothetical protein
MEEIWRDIEGYEGLYQVSNLGRVRSLDRIEKYGHSFRKRNGRILKSIRDKDGYQSVTLSFKSINKRCRVHRLVWEAFNGSIPDGIECNHLNERKDDNRLENLNLMTPKENCNWGTRNRRILRKKRRPVTQILPDGTEFCSFFSTRDASRETGINQGNICGCCNGKRKTAGGFGWDYVGS